MDPQEWEEELNSQEEFLKKIGDRLPKEISNEHSKQKERLKQFAEVK